MGAWKIITSEVYDEWFLSQTGDDMVCIRYKVLLLHEHGPNLGRPHADTLKGSKKLSNLKELRVKTDAHEFRIAYFFDHEWQGLVLVGGDKKGKNQRKFYQDLIRKAEQVCAAWLEKKAREKE